MNKIQTNFSKIQTNFSKINSTKIAPDFKLQRNSDIISYGNKVSGNRYGDYPDRLIGLFQNSSLHSAIIKGKILQIKANGFIIDEDINISGSTTDINKFMLNTNMDSNLVRNINDHQIFGGFALMLTFSRDFKKINNIEHIEYDKCRTTKFNNNGKITYWYYSNDWSSQKANKKRFKVITDFNEIKLKSDEYEKALNANDVDLLKTLSNDYTVIYYYNDYTVGRDYYPLPSYVAAIEAIDASQQIDTYFNNSMKKGFSADGMLVLKGQIDDEDFDEEAEDIVNAYSGAIEKGNLMVIRAKDAENMPKFVAFGSKGVDGRIEQTIKETTNRILTIHGVTSPLLVGIKTEGQLGGSTEMKEASEIFYKNTIKPNQIIISNYYNKIFAYNDLPLIKLDKLELIPIEE